MEKVVNENVVSEVSEKKKMAWWKKTLIGIGSSIGGIIAFLLTFILILNVGKWGIYHSYYSVREIVCTNHGLNENYVSQGTAITNDGQYVLTSGYMSDKSHSRVYLTNTKTDETKYIRFERNGKKNTYHCGGIATSGDNVYVVSNDKIFIISLTAIKNAENGAIFELGEGYDVNNQGSYVFTDDKYLYVGEFHDGKAYITDNPVLYEGVQHYAICSVYDLNDLTKLVKVYSVRDKVQGFAISAAGGILLSTSFGLTSSELYYYKESSLIDTQQTYDGAPLYFLKDHNMVITAPAMSEDLDYANGKFYTNFESGCNKYIFGKFFINSDKIVALDIEKLAR